MAAVPPIVQVLPSPVPADQGAVYNSDGSSAFQRLGFTILVLYLFLVYRRIFDVKLAFLHIPGIGYGVIFAMAILSPVFGESFCIAQNAVHWVTTDDRRPALRAGHF